MALGVVGHTWLVGALSMIIYTPCCPPASRRWLGASISQDHCIPLQGHGQAGALGAEESQEPHLWVTFFQLLMGSLLAPSIVHAATHRSPKCRHEVGPARLWL